MISNCAGACSPWARQLQFGRGEHSHRQNSESVRQRLTAANLSADTGVQLQITTDEGDVVTLSAQREVDLTLINYGERYRSGSENSRTELRASSLSVSSEIRLSVEGDLSDEERADIEALLQELQPSIDRFLETGKPVEVAPTPGSEYDSLAGFQLDLSSTRQLDLVAARFRSDTTLVTQPTSEETQASTTPTFVGDLKRSLQATARRYFGEGASEDYVGKITQHALAQAMERLTEQLQGIV